jgi:ring-1,2-phenylacetyl-CoA epoxidase subunit PaaE
LATHFRRLKVIDVRRETEDCVSIRFHVPDEYREEFKFQSGQNLTIKFQVDGEDIRRNYSICSTPSENELRIAVKRVNTGKFSTHANVYLKPGDELDVLTPSGRFSPHLDPSHKKNYVAFAAGSGITPVISIIKTTLETERLSSFTLVYGNRSRNAIIFKEELEALKNKYVNRLSIYHLLSREETDSPLNQGRISEEKCEQLSRITPILFADEFFLCGPGDMINTINNWLQKKNISKTKIHFEYFSVTGQPETKQILPGTADLRRAGSATSKVTIKSDGITFSFDLEYDGLTVLDAANATGADLPYACKAGVCSTCRARLIEGKVEMNVNYSLEQDEIDAGFILTCQSHPRSETLFIDFDEK